MPEGFAAPRFDAPLDLGRALELCPESTSVKGMFVDAVQKSVRALSATPVFDVRVVPFKDYPMRRHMELLAQWAKLAHPSETLREGLRRVGRSAYPDLTTSLVGKVIFGVLGRDLAAITKLVAKGYAISGSPQRATLVEHSPNHAQVRLDDVHFVDSYQVGVFEGAAVACGVESTVLYRPISETSCEMIMRWR